MRSGSRSRFSPPGRYPAGAIAAYGPDSRIATKLVVSVVERRGRDPSATRVWTTEGTDVRHDPAIAAEVAGFLRKHGAKQSVTSDRIIGCPHEEGIDYPMGRTCPRYPFWAGIDRFTHEPVTPPLPTMSPSEILADLSRDGSEPPLEALESADGHRHVLGKWREPRAYPYVVRWLSLPGEGPFDIAGDIVTQGGGRILAAVCNGDLEPLKALVVDRSANEYGWSAGVTALTLLALGGSVSRVRYHISSLAGAGGPRARAHPGVEQLDGRRRRHRSPAAVPRASPCL